MRYVGGKSKIAKQIAGIIGSGDLYIEPFLGGGAVFSEVAPNFKRTVASDSHLDLMLMWKSLHDGWNPPNRCDEAFYYSIKDSPSCALRGLIGFGQSFGGKWFGGYARGKAIDGTDRQWLAETIRNCQKIAPKFDQIVCADYRALNIPEKAVIYCDPPYNHTQGYGETFNTREFWKIMRKWRERATVYISEYDAPLDFECVAEFNHKQSLTMPCQGREARIERLWM